MTPCNASPQPCSFAYLEQLSLELHDVCLIVRGALLPLVGFGEHYAEWHLVVCQPGGVLQVHLQVSRGTTMSQPACKHAVHVLARKA